MVLESAYFHPTWIRKSARRHGLSTDASFRFERGIDPEGVIYALKQAAILCAELAGGKVSMEICDVYPQPIEGTEVTLSYDYVSSLIGKEIGHATIKNICESLEMKVQSEDEQGLMLKVPAYRVDVQRPCDVVEDILRIYGYNNVEIPTQLKGCLVVKGDEDKKHKLGNLVGEQLVGCGFNEILNNSLTKEAYYADSNAYDATHLVRIMNPLSSDLNVMRQTLLYGGLESIEHNVKRRSSNLRFFEMGNVYHFSPERANDEQPMQAYREDTHLSLWVTGKRVEGSWAHPNEDSTFFELEAYVLNIFSRVGLNMGATVWTTTDNNVFASARRLETRDGRCLAELGILNRTLLKKFDLDSEVYYAEIDWTVLMKAVRKSSVHYTELSKYPAVSRDLALLLDDSVAFEQVVEIARQTEKKLLKRVELFDVHEGKNLPAGKKSYAVNFILQDDSKTLNDKQIESIMQKLIANLKSRLGAELR